MTERRIAPLVPPRLERGAGHQLLASRVDLADLLPLPRAGALVYGMGRIDIWGVVSNRATIAALGWSDGDRLQIALVGGVRVVEFAGSAMGATVDALA